MSTSKGKGGKKSKADLKDPVEQETKEQDVENNEEEVYNFDINDYVYSFAPNEFVYGIEGIDY